MSAATRPDPHTAEAKVPTAEDRERARPGPEDSHPADPAPPDAEAGRHRSATTAGRARKPQPPLPAITGLALLALPLAVAGEVGALLTLGSTAEPAVEPGLPARVLTGSRVGFDLLLVLVGVALAWRTPADRKGLWRFGIWPLLAGLATIGGAALLLTLEQAGLRTSGLAATGRALAGLGTGTLTIYWLRMNTGSVRVPPHGPTVQQRIRTSRTAPLLAFGGLLFCAARPDVLAAAYLLPLYFASAWLVVTLVRAPHSPLTRLLDRLGKILHRNQPDPLWGNSQGPVRRQIILPDTPSGPICTTSDQADPSAQPEQTFDAPNQTRPDAKATPETTPTTPDPTTDHSDTGTDQADHTRSSPKMYVAPSGRVIDLARIPAELRLLPLPGRPGQKEQRNGKNDQTE